MGYIKRVHEVGFVNAERKEMFRMMMRLLEKDLTFAVVDDRGGTGAIKLVVDDDFLVAGKRLPKMRGKNWIKRHANLSIYA
jgi:hypothetical protein